MKFLIRNKKGDLELDQLGKLIIGVILFIILIYIVTVVIGGEIGNQTGEVGDVIGGLN